MSDANPGQHVPSPPWPEEAPPFTPPAPPPPGPDYAGATTAGPEAPEGTEEFAPVDTARAEQPGRRSRAAHAHGARRPSEPMGGAAKGLHFLADETERLLERPGSLAAWAVLLAVGIYWLSSVIGGLAHGSTFRDTFTHTAAYSGLNAQQRLDAFFGVGSYDMAFALLLALGLALLVPTRDERGVANGGQPADPSGVGPGRSHPGERASQRLLLVLTLAGLIVAFSALVMFISDLSRAGGQPDLSLQGAIQDLVAIPVALVVALWAASRVTEWPDWSHIASFTANDDAERRHSGPNGSGARDRQAEAGPPPSPPGYEEDPAAPSVTGTPPAPGPGGPSS